MAEKKYVSPGRKVGPSVLAPTSLVRTVAHRVQLAPSGCKHDLLARDLEVDQSLACDLGPLMRQRQVVDDAAAFVGLTGNGDMHVGIRFEPTGACLQGLMIFGIQVVAVEGEQDILQILLHFLLLLGAEYLILA